MPIMPKPDPKDFPSFEEYEQAVEIHEMMLEKYKEFEALQALNLPKEEFEKKAKALGFQKGKSEELFGEEAPETEMFMDLVNWQWII